MDKAAKKQVIRRTEKAKLEMMAYNVGELHAEVAVMGSTASLTII